MRHRPVVQYIGVQAFQGRGRPSIVKGTRGLAIPFFLVEGTIVSWPHLFFCAMPTEKKYGSKCGSPTAA
jgi:hypothetical protein